MMLLNVKTTYTTHIEITGPWDEREEAIKYALHNGFNNPIVTTAENNQYMLDASKPTPKGP